ncbi:MAG: phosphogluconate dehydratase, partial [Crocinitomicaceae bacterium]
MNKRITEITQRIVERSKETRTAFLNQLHSAKDSDVSRHKMHCGNLAHAFAGCEQNDKEKLAENVAKNIGIITAYNDMLSAHKVYENYPEKLRTYAREFGAVA